VYDLSAADGASPGLPQSLALGEDKLAPTAFRRLHNQLATLAVQGSLQVLEVAEDLLLRDPHLAGDFLEAERRAGE
jgi:hypothetical protein